MDGDLLVEGEKILEKFLDQAPGPCEIMMQIDPTARYSLVFCNSNASYIFGLPRVALNDEPVEWEELPESLSLYLHQAFEAISQTDDAALPVFELGDKERRAFSVTMMRDDFKMEDGKYYWFFFSFNDVTPWLSLQEEVMNGRRLESIGALASGVAHDFNNMIMAIRGQAEFLLMTKEVDDEFKTSMEQIVKACTNGSSLTRSLLGYAKKQSLDMDQISLSDVVHDVTELCKRSYGPRYIVEVAKELKTSGKEKVNQDQELEINGCYSALSHCVLNVMNNARDAMPSGGIIQVTYEVTEENVELTITDKGKGIDKEHLEHIFEPFFTTKENGSGTGLGLPMVHGIMQQHGGSIRVESEVEKGTSVTFSWPKIAPVEGEGLKPVRARMKRTTLSLPKLGKRSQQAVVIEDDSMVKSSVSNLLKANGFKVEAFDNAENVIVKLAAGFRPDLVLVDYTMPGMDGVEFISKAYSILKKQKEAPYMKIVLMSGYPPEHFSDFLKSFDGVPVYLLQKPFSNETLTEIILLKKKRFLRKITSRLQIQPKLKNPMKKG